mmetsp:Transcript_5854/g.6737  ORF Transcript_5854/g.6737 Transcript_5854/m.6737 type:complete len:140 (-) Transcript_5854:259-678(-)|eukprot:CAMPEP_0184013570 /NCGR_PEP_ID=MMETSP0954-20121128/5096_1 /TAXON_ID=627963 /ORGANISM="Aplanochytrium sp, Strain PBS07" /LENGTH=139 /DNA_ID=CAMNT_0026293793 /DNA_START=98 /DNA_END=517 /DNA_ORIENTATION=+
MADKVEVPTHVSGLWIGEAVPAEQFAGDTPVNPIKWSLSLLRDTYPEQVSAFGAGFFDDAGDIPGQPVIFYTLRGKFDSAEKTVDMEKIYETSLISEDLRIAYKGKVEMNGAEGRPVISGTWSNPMEGTHGTFACRLED